MCVLRIHDAAEITCFALLTWRCLALLLLVFYCYATYLSLYWAALLLLSPVCWPLVVTSCFSSKLLLTVELGDRWQCLKNLLFSHTDYTKLWNLLPLLLYRKSATTTDWSQYITLAEGKRWSSTTVKVKQPQFQIYMHLFEGIDSLIMFQALSDCH